MMQNNHIKVSVAIIAFNQSKYIKETIESVLMQKTTFNYEIVICEDNSTDDTRKICIEYKKQYPNKVNLVLNKSNLGYSKNFINVLSQCNGEYIALCEGDDYWTLDDKLEKQVIFLDNHSKYSLCCHDYNIMNEFTGELINVSATNKPLINSSEKGGEFDNKINLLQYWYTKTMTVMFRREYVNLQKLCRYNHFYDVHLYYHILVNAPGYYMKNFNAAIYRLHDSFHNGKDWTHKAEVAFLNDKGLYQYNSHDMVVAELFKKTKSLYLESLKYKISKDGLTFNLVLKTMSLGRAYIKNNQYKSALFVFKSIGKTFLKKIK